MDISMPGLNGVGATSRILEDSPDTRVIALSMHSDRAFVSRALRAGASGYLVKECAFDELVLAIRAAVAGRVYLSPSIAHVVLEDYVSDGSKVHTSSLAALSAREREVMQLLAEGKTTRQAARCLHLSPKTIETHRANIMKKLNLCGLADLVRYAIREGLAALEC
jgi:DNA-binding NarL/FixJ family response regulator